MKRRDLLQFEAVLISTGELKGIEFASVISKNSSLIKPEIDAILAASENFENTRLEICLKHAKKDGEGKPVFQKINETESLYVFQDRAAFDAEIAPLKAEMEKYMDVEVVVEWVKVKKADVPKDINVKQYDHLKIFFEE